MDNQCIILLVLIIVLSTLIVFSIKTGNADIVFGGTALLAVGASECRQNNPNKAKKVFIGDNERLVIDGHNMIHQLAGGHLDILEFERTLKDISAMLIIAFPTQDKHIVLKNPPEHTTKIFNKVKKEKSPRGESNSRKKSSEEHIPYFRELVKISKFFPTITYHLAYAKDPKSSKKYHHLRGRDDFLSIMLAKGSYVVSQDRFRDFKHFSTIKPFKHYSVTNGSVHPKETIKPLQEYRRLDEPTVGNHFIFKIISTKESEKLGVENGSIYLTDDSVFGCMYIVRPY
jgi:hypothetical protein